MNAELAYVIYGGIVLFLILSVSMVFFVIAYRKTQRAHISEKKLLKKAFQAEMLETQLEISEQTMKQIAQDIHDNLGQRMTLAIQMNQQGRGGEDLQPILQDVLHDLRDLSKSLHATKIHEMGLDLALERECELIAKATQIPCNYAPPENRIVLSEQAEIILFRCAQEILNNAIKHAEASELKVKLSATKDAVMLKITDDGKGFDVATNQQGLGLHSLQNRVEMIDGLISIKSSKESGTRIDVTVPQHLHP